MSEIYSTRWIPLESNPDVLNRVSEKLGLPLKADSFTEIYDLSEDLLSLVPKPVKAIVVLFPITAKYEETKKVEDKDAEEGKLTKTDSTIVFLKQTISNACGTIGLLHALMNSNVTISPGSPLAKFLEDCQSAGMSPEGRAKLLETTPLFASIHKTEAQTGQTAVPTNLDTEYHFTCFVLAPSDEPDQVMKGENGHRLIELDGRRVGPIDRGASEDLLKDAATFIRRRFIDESGCGQLAMFALTATADD